MSTRKFLTSMLWGSNEVDGKEEPPDDDIDNPPEHFQAWLEWRKALPEYKTWPSEYKGPSTTLSSGSTLSSSPPSPVAMIPSPQKTGPSSPGTKEELDDKRKLYPTKHKDILNLFQQNREWADSRTDADPDFFAVGGKRHKPKYMWIGCADARVPANEIMGEDSGSVFVARNVANLVVGTDFNLMASVQYAVEYLKLPHIIVCGHYDCGGIRACTKNLDHQPPLENWLRNIRDVYRLHRAELDAIDDPEARHRRLVEINVIEQCINLFKTGIVQRRRVETFNDDTFTFTQPRIHAVVYDPKDGKLRQLQVDFKEYLKDIDGIYNLYQTGDKSGIVKEKKTSSMIK